MVLAVGPQGPSDLPPPQNVKESVAKWWWALVVIYLAICLARFYVGDLWGGMISTCMCFWAWWMVRVDCKQMSQYCIMLFGMLSFFEVLIDLVNFLSCIHGRVQEKESETPLGASSNGAIVQQYTVSVEEHAFFDSRLGFLYNLQSALMILILLCDGLGAFLSYWTYHAYPTSLFDDSDEEEGRSFAAGARSSAISAYGSSLNGGVSTGSGGRQTNTNLFEGTGQRLCDLDK
mmetsp:Transcript_37986/g.60169  ORF Transcript_37986/g.60169 Transcript_37986/m.60169 type:complete len:232 (+) Transcript_37986:62-757(+)